MKILLISGHGNGDPGAVSRIDGICYREYEQTRRVTEALKKALSPYCEADIYPTSHNAYHDYHAGVLTSTAKFKNYDYVLEVHFNAISASGYDGKTKGVECYVTRGEKGTGVENLICKKVAAVGLRNRGVKRYNYAVINTAKKNGVSSALLEVCFIDDPDDMAVYLKRFDDIVNAIANGIAEGFGLRREEEDDMTVIYKTYDEIPDWGKPTIKKLMDKGYLKGEGGNNINVEYYMLRTLVINDKAGLYN